MIIKIDLHVEQGYFQASAFWGKSTWHANPVTALEDLVSKALILVAEAHDEESKKSAQITQGGPN